MTDDSRNGVCKKIKIRLLTTYVVTLNVRNIKSKHEYPPKI